MADQNRGRTNLPVRAFPQAAASSPAAEYGNQARSGQRQSAGKRPQPFNVFRLRNWRVRWRVLALVIVPTVAAIVLGLVRVEAANTTASNFGRISQLATLGRDFTALTQSVEDERDLSAGYLASKQEGDTAQAAVLLVNLNKQYGVTDSELAASEGLANTVSSAGSGNPQTTRNDAAAAVQNLTVDLPDLRGFLQSQIDPLAMTTSYSQLITPMLAFDEDIAAGSSSPQLALFATVLESAAQMEEQASQQRALLYAALFQGQFQPGLLTSLVAAQTDQASNLSSFQSAAANVPAYVPASAGTQAGFSPTLTQVQQFSGIDQGPLIDDAQRIELDAIIAGQAGGQPNGGVGPAAEWFTDMTSDLGDMRVFDADELGAISSQADTLRQGALGSERLTALIVLILLLVVLAITILVAQSMIRPLRRLREDALDVAGRRLPDIVQRLSRDSDESIEIEPIGIDSTDEIGEVARAFDQISGEAVRLAGEEALLRANLNAMFVNLSRRSQSLIERQLGIIETLEQSEQDSDRLSSLFRLDHLATRMRRNSENLLVLAGHEAPRKWTKPVPLVDVLRAAVSEIEQYERITMNVQAGLVIAGRAASDVVHLAAELAENATTFSREDTQVRITGQLLTSGGVLVEITDEGLGIPEQELAHANWRLDNPPVIDVAVSRRMGLFVVGRLAARHGIKVRLRRANSGGLSALIWVPETVAEAEPVQSVGTRRRPGSGTGGVPSVQSATMAAMTATAPTIPPVPSGPQMPSVNTGHSLNMGPSVNTMPTVGAPPMSPALGTQLPTRVPSTWFSGDTQQAAEPDPVLPVVPVAPVGAPVATEPILGVAEVTSSVRLPIYDSVESDWFRRGAPLNIAQGQVAPAASWTSPADEGFRAAQTVVSPTTDSVTTAGLPKRVPSANLVPGSIAPRPAQRAGTGQAPPPPPPPLPARSPDAVRARLAGFQLRGRQGRANAPQENEK
jgi:signal transduction histidine kinase